jgi:hypothetical protein
VRDGEAKPFATRSIQRRFGSVAMSRLCPLALVVMILPSSPLVKTAFSLAATASIAPL